MGDIMVTERPLIQTRTPRWDDDEGDVDSKFELVLGAGKKSQHFCSRVYIFRTQAQTKDNPDQETTPKKRPRKIRRPSKRIRVEPRAVAVGGHEADVEAAAGRRGTEAEVVVAALQDALRVAQAVGEVVNDDNAVQRASTVTEDTADPPRTSTSKTTQSSDAKGTGEAAAGNNIAGSGPPEVEPVEAAAAASRDGESTNSRSTAERMNNNLDDEFAREARGTDRREEGRVYTVLNGCKINTRFLFNVWAVITKVSRQPSPTDKKPERIMATVYIKDQTFFGSFGYPDYQFRDGMLFAFTLVIISYFLLHC